LLELVAERARVLSIGPGLGRERIPIAKRFGGKVEFHAVGKGLHEMYADEVLQRLAETSGARKETAELCRNQRKHEMELDFENPECLRRQLFEITGGKTGFFREIHVYGVLVERRGNGVKPQLTSVVFHNPELAKRNLLVLSEFLENGGYVCHLADSISHSPLLGGLPREGTYAERRRLAAKRFSEAGITLCRYGERPCGNPCPWELGSSQNAATNVERSFLKFIDQYTAVGGLQTSLTIGRKQRTLN
jgi:hypothetical protein